MSSEGRALHLLFIGLATTAVLFWIAISNIDASTASREPFNPTRSLPATSNVTTMNREGEARVLLYQTMHQLLHWAVVRKSGNRMGNVANTAEQPAFIFSEVDRYFFPPRPTPQPLPRPPQGYHVCEMGFNIGHSAAVFLAALYPYVTRVTIFDVGEAGQDLALEIFRQLFPNTTFTVVQGYTRDTVPEFRSARGEECHVMHIDAEHSYEEVKNDVQNARRLVLPESLIVFDDCWCNKWCEGPTKAFEELVRDGALRFVAAKEIQGMTGSCFATNLH